MDEFIARHQDEIAGVLSGFDRLAFRGTLRRIAYPFGLQGFLWANQAPLKEFGAFASRLSETVKAGAVEVMDAAGRPVKYLYSSRTDKEQVAREIAAKDGIEEGPVCALTCVEPCYSYDVYRNRQTRQLDLVQRSRKCLFVYQYWLDATFGWMNARIQTWLPFSIQICLNGREWLARQMAKAGMGYEKRDNCFVWVEDWVQARQLFDEQLHADWPGLLNGIARRLSPHHDEIFAKLPVDYYWSGYQTEWATDVTFQRQADLRRLFALWLRHAILTFQSPDVLRFFGKRLTNAGEVPASVKAEVTSSLKRRQAGTRVKHWYGSNSVKIYDKAYAEVGSTVRAEVTMQDPEPFKVYRRPEGEPQQPQQWYRLRQGVADLHRRAEICQKINERYLNALAAVDTDTSLEELLADIQRPIVGNQRRYRALQPFAEPDVLLLEAISRGEFLVQGFRNRDLQQLVYRGAAVNREQQGKRSAAISRRLRLLRAHGIIRKVPKTHRYHVTTSGREILAAIMAARKTTLKHLNTKAA